MSSSTAIPASSGVGIERDDTDLARGAALCETLDDRLVDVAIPAPSPS